MRQLSKLAFSFQFKDRIWKTAIDQESGLLALELRNEEELQTTYVMLDILSGTHEDAFTIEGADWWSALLSVTKGHLFIEKYDDPQNPLAKSLIIANANDGRVFRHLTGHQLVEVKDQSVILQKVEDPNSFTEEQLPEHKHPDSQHEFLAPMVFPEGSDNFATVQSFLSEEIGQQVEYLELEDVIVISYCTPLDKGFARALLVLKEEKEIYRATLDKKIEGVAPGAFFVFENFLIFIVERKQINAIKL